MSRPRAIMMPSASPESADRDQLLVEAISHYHAGRTDVAENLYRTIIASPPGHAVASYGLGLLCAALDRPAEAITAYRQAIGMRPDFVEAYINLGTTLLALGRREEAVALYRQATAISPDNAMAHGNLGKALQDLGRIDEAIIAYREAIARQPGDPGAYANLGAALLEKAAWNESVTVTRRAIALQPDNAMTHANLGTALMNLGRREEALAACHRAAALNPREVAVIASLGGAMLEMGASVEAVALCRHAISLDPTLPTAWFNLSHAFKAMNQLEDAGRAARRAIELCPASAEYHFHLAHVLLLMGNLEEGWIEYDWRLKLPAFARISGFHEAFSRPMWGGEEIRAKTILIHAEQGLGDIMMFARYLPLVSRLAARVIVAVHPRMHRLLETVEGITIVSNLDTPPDFDVHCPLLSLPRAFATRLETIPASVPYLYADLTEKIRWIKRLDARQSVVDRAGGVPFRVGIVWAGNPATKRDHVRSPGLNSVAPLFSVPGIDFIALQVGPGRADLDTNPLPPNVLDLGEEIADLADTAAIISGLDLMISSCTAPLHLAGALGIRTWALIPFAPWFPWLLDRADTPWYPNMTLYRQDQPGQDWSGVVGRIAMDLAVLRQAGSKFVPVPSPISRRSVPAGASSRGVSSERLQSIAGQDGFNELARCRSGLMIYNRNDTYIGASLRKYGEFSGEETALFRVIVQPGRTVLDIGANIGVHTVDLSRLAGVVHAFEPQRLIYQTLCANLALNSRANVFAYNAAVGAAQGTLLVPSLDPAEHHNYGGVSLSDSLPGTPVPVITIDSLDLADCQFIKLDVEGMETEALRGAAATIRRFRPILYVENDRQSRSVELIGLLQHYDYRLYWHLPPIYTAGNFRADTENIFGAKVSVNMICIPSEVPQSSMTNLREVTGPADHVVSW